MEVTACVFLPKDHLFQVPPFTALVLLKHGPLSSSCLGNTGKLHGSSHTVEMGLPSLPLGESLREAESHRQSCFRSDGQNRTGFFFVSFNKEQFPTLLILPTLSKMSGMLKINDNPCERETDTKEHWFHHTQFSFLPLSIADSVLCFGKTPPEFFLPFSAQIFGNFCFTKHKRGGRGDLVDAVSCIQNKAEPWAVSWAEE